jgi:hypothetical protein
MMGVLSVLAPELLLESTPLARLVLLGFAIFWAVRLAVQWLVYDRALWWGHPFNTSVHIAFTILWTYLGATYLAAWWSSR